MRRPDEGWAAALGQNSEGIGVGVGAALGQRLLRLVGFRLPRFWAAALVCLFFTQVPGLAEANNASEARAITVSATESATTLEVLLSNGVPVEIFTLANPYRVIIDLPDVAFKLPPETGRASRGLIAVFRYGLFAEGKARIVIDTSGPVKIAQAGMTEVAKGMSLKIILEPTDAESFGAGTGASRQSLGDPAPADEPAPAPQPVKPVGKPVIVIDPGHGGIDPGAVSSGSITEKSVVLAVGTALQAALKQTGRYDVKMTRSTDVFVSLDKRLKFSEDNGADLFISLHADSIEERQYAEAVRGATIYTLSERASDEQARQMAEKENASDLLAGLESGGMAATDQVKNILIDLLKRETSNFSADFSNVLARRLGKTITLSRDPQRSAAFKVLKQPHAPSVLIELGYISNSRDQEQMITPGWQKQVATAIAAAVQTYFTKRTVGQQ